MCKTIDSRYNENIDGYGDFLASIEKQFETITSNQPALFKTNVVNLYDVFLEQLSEEHRQHYTCSACKKFVDTYGNLVSISENGEVTSVFWQEETTPTLFKEAVQHMRECVQRHIITDVFLTSKEILGTPVTGGWYHMSVHLRKEQLAKSLLLNAGQMMAEKREDFRILKTSVNEFSLEIVNQALLLLKSETLYRSERCLGVAQWFQDLQMKLSGSKNDVLKDNILWKAVATAPVGFCHIRSTMIGTLLVDIASGLSFDAVSKRFAEKMHPLQYQRPQAAPTEGNVKEAEKIIEKLGAEKSLERRFARLEELNLLWKPQVSSKPQGTKGIFSHLITKLPKQQPQIETPTITMTWRKFSETVLPDAIKIEYFAQDGKANFAALLTAVHEDSFPIFQWDTLAQRNPLSWYVYVDGSEPKKWGLKPGYCEVSGVCLQPSMWYGNYPHQGKSVFFILAGAKDHREKGSGSAIFPSMLISELRAIRATIEAYSNATDLQVDEQSSACGIKLEGSSTWSARFRVTTPLGVNEYILDRWD